MNFRGQAQTPTSLVGILFFLEPENHSVLAEEP